MSAMRTVVLGEALVDLVIAPDGSVTATPGGAPYNTARAIGRLGAPVSFGGAVSDDRFGRAIGGRLVDDGVATDLVQDVTLPTTLAAAEVDEGGAATYRFYLDGTSAPAFVSPALDDAVDVGIVMTGGLGLVLEPMATSVVSALGSLPGDALVLVDVNCRPAVIDERDAYVERIGEVVERAHIVKVSDEDLAYLMPGVAALDAAAALLGRGPAVVLLTAGASGVTILTAAGTRHVPVEPVEVVDTIGAGDAFGGGVAAWWLLGERSRGDLADLDVLERCVSAANLVAAITCTRRGAEPPRRSELPESWVSGHR